MAVDADCFADIADFIGKRHLQPVPGIIGILDHLGDFDAGMEQRRVNAGIELGNLVAARVVDGADHSLRRHVEITDGGALA